jgi:hypothetical protein
MGYLEENPSFKLSYQHCGSEGLDGFADSKWANSLTRCSTTGLLERYNRDVVQWRSKIQKTVSRSTAEAEYVRALEMEIEVLYLLNLLENMGFLQAPNIQVYEDNTTCIEWGNHVIGGWERAKHINIRKHFVHETIQKRKMRLVKADTSSQLADIFTKPLHLQQFLAC